MNVLLNASNETPDHVTSTSLTELMYVPSVSLAVIVHVTGVG